MKQVRQLLENKGHAIHQIAPDAPVLEAIRLMAERQVGALLVMQDHRLIGILSERDYARKVILQGRSSAQTLVADIMTTPAITISPDTEVFDCMRLCTDTRIRHLPVVEGEQVVGIISIGDLVKAVIEVQAEQIEELQRYITS